MQDRKTEQQVPISSEGCPLGIMHFSLAVAKSSLQLQDNHLFLSALYKKAMSITWMPSSWVPQLTLTRFCDSSFISFIYALCCTEVIWENWQWNSANMNFGTEYFYISERSYCTLVTARASIYSSDMLLRLFLRKRVFGKKTKQRKK